MEKVLLVKYWTLIHSILREFWDITEPHIENAAIQNDIPTEFYYYSELGLETFSVENFQKRDPFTNPEQFERLFARFVVKGWIVPMPDDEYQVTDAAMDATRKMIEAGDEQLAKFESFTNVDLKRIISFLKQIVTEDQLAAEPPQKWSLLKRFHVANDASPDIARIREYMMDLFAYRDDCRLSASRPHFGQAGIVWNVLTSVWNGEVLSADQMAENMSFRGYDASDYEVAIQAALEIGWLETADSLGKFRARQIGRDLLKQVEQLTNEYFFRTWSVLTSDELNELYALLTQLYEQLMAYKRSITN